MCSLRRSTCPSIGNAWPMSAHRQTVPSKQPAASNAPNSMSALVVETRPPQGATYNLPLPIPYHPGHLGKGWADTPHVPSHRTLPPISTFAPREAHSEHHEAGNSYNYSAPGPLAQRPAQRPPLRSRQSSGSLGHILLHPPGDGPASPHVSPISAGGRQKNPPGIPSPSTTSAVEAAEEIPRREMKEIRQAKRRDADDRRPEYSPASSESSMPKRGRGRPGIPALVPTDLEERRNPILTHSEFSPKPAGKPSGNM